jgi:Cu+-exporting ATPase
MDIRCIELNPPLQPILVKEGQWMVSARGLQRRSSVPVIVTGEHTTATRVNALANSHCFHCGNKCSANRTETDDRAFCCQGCLAVYEILNENGLSDYYKLDAGAGVRVPAQVPNGKFGFLDETSVRQRIVSFSNEKTTRVVFQIPAVHCIACVWLLENLFRLNKAIGKSEVDFLRKELTLNFATDDVPLSEVVALLASLGYEPELKFSDLESKPRNNARRKLWLQLGVAGFAFGNNMLFAIALYLGVDAVSGPSFRQLVGYLSLSLALPVLLFSAQDYFRLAWQGLKQKLLTIEVPIAVGILVIFTQSAWDVLSGRGVGYFDSFAGLLFFLLCGRLFQQKSYERLAFDRDFKSFFPLSVTRRSENGEQHVSLSGIQNGDRLIIRNGELIPADGKLIGGVAVIDYSFVTGEAEPVELTLGDYIYAGGRQTSGAIEVETVKPVSQSYLTSLWNQDIFKKESSDSLDSLINRYSQRFTKLILAIGIAVAGWWAFVDPSKSLIAFTSVLIVACPCALALAAPFALGAAIRVLGRLNVFVKSPQVIERLAKIDTVVFDKTGTLTASGATRVQFEGAPLSTEEKNWIYSTAVHSLHPHSVRVAESLNAKALEVRSFAEIPGCGLEATVSGRRIVIGSGAWLRQHRIDVPDRKNEACAHVAFDGTYHGVFLLPNAVRDGAAQMISALSPQYHLALLSGDNERERANFEKMFDPTAVLKFNQGPLEKLEYIRELQSAGKRPMMIGDGLNDAGALRQSDVGVAVVETIGAFCPASDIIMRAQMAPQIHTILQFSKGVTRIVKLSFGISSVYNIVGISIAASAKLAPIICAILMPLSSISVVAFACLATSWYAGHINLGKEAKT